MAPFFHCMLDPHSVITFSALTLVCAAVSGNFQLFSALKAVPFQFINFIVKKQ